MTILLLGSGAREHALADKILQSHHCQKLFVAPGNAGTASIAQNVLLNINDFSAIANFCIQEKVSMVVVGPEEPLVNGIYDYLINIPELAQTILVAPTKNAAQLEGSKAFAKAFMQRHNIPTASYAEFDSSSVIEGKQYISHQPLPIVLKANGLAAGKGVVICQTHQEAETIFEEMVLYNKFGDAGRKVVIEEFLKGIEVSVFVLTNGKDYQIIGHAKDYKQVGEGNTGANTGGMGCITPVPFMDDAFIQTVNDTIIKPTINGLQQENLIYHGFIFFGLMNCNGVPKVIEYNCRLGDPETEVVLPRLETDLVSLFAAMDNGTLADTNIEYKEGFFTTVVAASAGYPEAYEKNIPITGLEELQNNKDAKLYFAAIKQHENGEFVTNGGRVLTATANASTLKQAVAKSNAALQQIEFEGKYYRKDIGWEFIV